MKMITERHPEVLGIILRAISGGSEVDAPKPSSPVPPVSRTLVSSLPEEVTTLARHQRGTPTPRFNPVRELASGSGLQN